MIGVIVVLSGITATQLGCSSNQVELTKQPLTLEKVFLEDVKDRSDIPLAKDEEALTTWKLGCKTDFDFQIVDNTSLKNDDFMVAIKITKVHLTLTAPITMWISKTAPPAVLHHEQAHVQICERIYDGINESALSAGRSVIGREYQASGKTKEDACRQAIERSAEDVYQQYHSAASETIHQISTIFDELEQPAGSDKKHSESIEEIDRHLEEAFSKFKSNIGVKQKT